MRRSMTGMMLLAAALMTFASGCGKHADEGKKTFEQSSKEVNGMKVTLVHITGTYLAPGGPMMQSQGEKANYRLLGAIVEGPLGSVFFKLTGPDNTIKGAQSDFDALVGSLKKQEGEQAASNAVAGLTWTVPGKWTEEGPRPMRAATYSVPPASGDSEKGECAVFYFGNDQGGSVDANIERWKSQFKDETKK